MLKKINDFSPLLLAAIIWVLGLPLVLATHSTKATDSGGVVVYAGLLVAIVAAWVFKQIRGDRP